MPGSTSQPMVAAIVNTSPDIVDLIRRALEPAGIVAVSLLTHRIRDGGTDVDSFLRHHDPRVVVYDIAPPYDANLQLFQHVCRMQAMHGRRIVLTSTNVRHVERLVGRHEKVYEVVGKPLDLDQIVQAVKEAARARPSR